MRKRKVGSGDRVTLGGRSLALKVAYPLGSSQNFLIYKTLCLAYPRQLTACRVSRNGQNLGFQGQIYIVNVKFNSAKVTETE